MKVCFAKKKSEPGTKSQCLGYSNAADRFRDPMPFWALDPGSGMGKKNQDPESGMNNPDHISESLETIFGLKYFNSWIGIRDGKNSDPGWKKFGSG
jgi:hypothetical protein